MLGMRKRPTFIVTLNLHIILKFPEQAQRISVTVRTIISGLCYLSISVFAFNSIGLFLYSGQLLMNPEEEEDSPPKTESEGEDATE